MEYERYFLRHLKSYQSGGSALHPKVGNLYTTSRKVQRGRGLSDAFGSLFKFLSPYLVRSGRALGNEALRSGSEILAQLGTKPLGDILKKQVLSSAQRLSERANRSLKRTMGQTGEGINRKRRRRTGVIKRLEQLAVKGVKRQRGGKKRGRKTTNRKRRSTGRRKKRSKSAFLKQILGR